VKPSNIELISQPPSGFFSEAKHLELPYLVGEGLSWPTDVAVYLIYHIVLRERRIFEHEFYCLLPCPTFRMHSGVDDKPTGSPRVEG
jgi:hypothetical protein